MPGHSTITPGHSLILTPERLFSYINPNVAKVEDAADIIEKINQRGIPVLLVEQKVTFALKVKANSDLSAELDRVSERFKKLKKAKSKK